MYLTRRSLKFIEHFTSDCMANGRKAAIKAGYTTRNASNTAGRLLKDADICKEIDLRLQALKLSDAQIEQEIAGVAKNTHDERNKLRALELLARVKGMFKDSSGPQVALFQGMAPQAYTHTRVKTQNADNAP